LTKRCAIYTRKSTDEGLDLKYNSLDAQRDACLAYIKSQSHEGWTPVEQQFDDGGYTGGNLERPALKRLIREIERGHVDVVVIHKIDRLTRSLMDFAKLADMLDRNNVSFVSVTQHLNTADSVGRLSLNMLLSFAQFEREIASERIREKILASRRRGLWTGGLPPLGYDSKKGSLVVNELEAECVRHIFRRYVELRSVDDLRLELQRDGINSKVRRYGKGGRGGGKPFSRGALYAILRNVLYCGEIRCGNGVVAGIHEAIVPPNLWLAASKALEAGRRKHGRSQNCSSAVLLGKIFDANGRRITRSSTFKKGKRYRYYATPPSQGVPASERVRIPCDKLDQKVAQAVATKVADHVWLFANILTSAEDRLKYAARDGREKCLQHNLAAIDPGQDLMTAISSVTIGEQVISIAISNVELRATLLGTRTHAGAHIGDPIVTIQHPVVFRRRGKQLCAVVPGKRSRRQRADEILAEVARAKSWYAGLCNDRFRSLAEVAAAERVSPSTISRRIPLAFLSPIIEGLLRSGRIPDHLDRQWVFNNCPLPGDWGVQEQLLLRKAAYSTYPM
jgi:DNA invertase Pin-like site-specific DNA recombinase